MKVIKTFFTLILFFGIAEASPDLFLPGQQAEAYAEANDLEQAAEMYDKIGKLSLPDWQEVIRLYNLGTAKLELNQMETSYQLFQEIKKGLISSPWLLRDLEMNIALSSLLAAKNSAASLKEGAISQSPDLLSQVDSAIHHLKIADALTCLIDRLEIAGAPMISCTPHNLIIVPLQEAYRLLGELKSRLLNELAVSERNGILLLVDGLNNLSHRLKSQTDINQFLPYYLYQAETLLPLWNNLKEEKESKEKYNEMIGNLEKGKVDQAIETLNTLKKNLENKLGDHAIDALILNYQLILYTEPLFNQKLHKLLDFQKKTKVDEKTKNTFDQSVKYLEKSISFNDKGQSDNARFYLAAALTILEETKEKVSNDDPITVLENALSEERNSLLLNHLFSLISIDLRNEEMLQILKKSQQKVLELVPLFVAATLKDEQKHYEKKECQKTPWDQAIPLFSKGARKAQQASLFISQNPTGSDSALDEQTDAIKYWKELLNMLKNPPSSGQSKQQEESSAKPIEQAPTSPDETLQLLQEMQLQDQKEQWQMPKEFKSW